MPFSFSFFLIEPVVFDKKFFKSIPKNVGENYPLPLYQYNFNNFSSGFVPDYCQIGLLAFDRIFFVAMSTRILHGINILNNLKGGYPWIVPVKFGEIPHCSFMRRCF